MHYILRSLLWCTLCLGVLINTPILAQARFSLSPNGEEVIDSQQKLAFRRCLEPLVWVASGCHGAIGDYTWSEAQRRAQYQTELTGRQWRIPTQKELVNVFDRSINKISIATPLFPTQAAGHVWTTSPIPSYPNELWIVHFNSGQLSEANKNSGIQQLRLVRSLE